MSIPQNKFEVGEEVILQTNWSTQDGEYVIVEKKYAVFNDTVNQQYVQCWGYNLNGAGWWHEICLRKKHKPAQDDNGNSVSFSQLLNDLNKIKT
jgi:hypothetical protein